MAFPGIHDLERVHAFFRLRGSGDVRVKVDHGIFRAFDFRLVHLQHALRLILRDVQGLGSGFGLGWFGGGKAELGGSTCDSDAV